VSSLISGKDQHSLIINVVAGILVVCLLWLVRVPLLRLLVSLLRMILRHGPKRLKDLASRGADDLLNFPDVRSLPREDLAFRLQHLREAKAKSVVLFGSVYVDINVRPVGDANLREGEFDDVSIDLAAGGSARYVGHYLWKDYHVKSYLFSRVGAKQYPLTRVLNKAIAKEDWIKGRPQLTVGQTESGISVHLQQADGSFRTTYTQRGALNDMGWDDALPKLHSKLGRTGVLFISGYFRTSLWRNLCGALESLSVGTIVCMDHGRFQADDANSALRSLLDAFKAGFVDCYLCTADEMRDLAGTFGLPNSAGDPLASVAHSMASAGVLPRITVALDTTHPLVVRVHTVVDGNLDTIERAHKATDWRGARPGPRNSFSAGFLHKLSSGDPGTDLRGIVGEAAQEGMERWIIRTQ
jgi:hypothetical protein